MNKTNNTGSSTADRCLILSTDASVPLRYKMDKEIASAINRVLFHQQAPAQIRIINDRRNAGHLITEMMHYNATAEMALRF